MYKKIVLYRELVEGLAKQSRLFLVDIIYCLL
jgi:hypothetical protein